MATLVKQSGRYYSQFFSKDKSPNRKRVSLKTNNKRIAVKVHRDLEAKYAIGDFNPWIGESKPSPTKDLPSKLGHLIDSYIKMKSIEDWRRTTARNTGYVLRSFGRHTGQQLYIGKLCTHHVNNYLNQKRFAYETKKTHCAKLKAFIRWANSHKVTDINLKEIKIFNHDAEQEETVSFLTEKEIEQLKIGIETIVLSELKKGFQKPGRNALWLIDFIDWQRWSGMRISETLNLRVKDIDTNSWLVRIGSDSFSTKSKSKQILPIGEVKPLKKLCNKRLACCTNRNERLFGHKDRCQVTRLFKKYLRRVLPEREDITVHSLRHTCCIELLRAGVPIYTVQRWLRHADVKTTQRYADLLNMDISEQVGKAFR